MDQSFDNKENIPEGDKLAGSKALRKQNVNSSPAAASSNERRSPGLRGAVPVDNAVQTETAEGRAAYFESAYKDLMEDHEEALEQCDKLKSAHATLIEKAKKNRRSFEVWVKEFQQLKMSIQKELGQWKARRDGTKDRDEAISRLETLSHELKDPPGLSPEKPAQPQGIDSAPIRKGGLFSNLKKSVPVQAQNFTGDLGKQIPDWRPRKSASPFVDPIPSDPPSSAEIPETLQELPENVSTTPHRVLDDENMPTSDAESDHSTTPKAKVKGKEPKEPTLPPPPQPGSNKRKRQEYDGTPSKPVVIKSEPNSSGTRSPGYHIFDEETLDLDDVAQRPRSAKPKKQKPKADTAIAQKDDQVNETVPPIRGVRLSSNPPSGTRSPKIATPEKTPEEPIKPTTKRQKPAPTEGAMEPPTTIRINTKAPQSAKKTPAKKTPAPKRPRDKTLANISVLEDGTEDGDKTQDRSKDPADVKTPTRLGDLLANPTPENPSLRTLARDGINSRSAPPKPSRGWPGDGFDEPVPPTTEPRQAQMAPPLPRASTADVDEPLQTARCESPSIEHFRINPENNHGRNFAYHETVRAKEARSCLPGCSKPCCQDLGKFVEAAGLPLLPQGPRWRQAADDPQIEEDGNGQRRFIERYGKHRDAFPRHRTPPGFWDSDFPDTQKNRERNEEADRMRRARAEEMQREAQKKGGRYMYR